MATVAQIIDNLGGSASVSRETGFPLTTIESWKAARFIPEWRRESLLALAIRLDVPLSTADFPARPAKGDASDHAAGDTTGVDAPSSGISGEVSAQAEGLAA